MRLSIDRLSAGDIDHNVSLAGAVGWPDTVRDWRVLHQAALVLGVWEEKALVAQGALGLYGSAGTIAKMVVAPEYQRRGIGLQLLDALLAQATLRSSEVLGLVASPAGRPLYERRQFVHAGDIVILVGEPRVREAEIQVANRADPDVVIQVDERWLGVSRATMLRGRLRDAIASASVVNGVGVGRGYAMASAQGTRALVGPIVAETEAEARALVAAVFRTVKCPVGINVPADQLAFRSWLRQVGLEEREVRAEMAFGRGRLPWQVPQRFALATQAWG